MLKLEFYRFFSKSNELASIGKTNKFNLLRRQSPLSNLNAWDEILLEIYLILRIKYIVNYHEHSLNNTLSNFYILNEIVTLLVS